MTHTPRRFVVTSLLSPAYFSGTQPGSAHTSNILTLKQKHHNKQGLEICAAAVETDGMAFVKADAQWP